MKDFIQSKMRNLIKKIATPVLRKIHNWYFSKPRKYYYKDSFVWVHPNVFPPHYTISTKIFLNFINDLYVENKTFLELGCGSGIISIHAAKKGAFVTASDINKDALNQLKINSKLNNVTISIVYSNLFENLNDLFFDYIVINPPYYPKKPVNEKEKAWFCGENYEYFYFLFQQLQAQLVNKSKCYMILSEDCHIEKIQKIASEFHINFLLTLSMKKSLEKNYIYLLH